MSEPRRVKLVPYNFLATEKTVCCMLKEDDLTICRYLQVISIPGTPTLVCELATNN